jgi:hypothetical protein
MQRMRAARASQILSRMLRRSRGPLWMKEAQLVCFHMWRRFNAVRSAYRKQQADPQFGYPYLPQWTQLMKQIVLTRARKEQVRRIGSSLESKVWFDRWIKVKRALDSRKTMSAEEIADQRYVQSLTSKVLSAWNGHCREKGKIYRLRLKIFVNWRTWAPRKRRLAEFKTRTIFWMNRRRSRRAFDVLIDLCEATMSRRLKAIRVLQDRMRDRKVLLCAYGFLGRYENMHMLEYWRRWIIYRKNCLRWRAALLECRYNWYQSRNKGNVSSCYVCCLSDDLTNALVKQYSMLGNNICLIVRVKEKRVRLFICQGS